MNATPGVLRDEEASGLQLRMRTGLLVVSVSLPWSSCQPRGRFTTPAEQHDPKSEAACGSSAPTSCQCGHRTEACNACIHEDTRKDGAEEGMCGSDPGSDTASSPS